MSQIYSLTILTSAFLLFLVQPMAAKVLLPHLGGTPAVWNTAMMFFQTLLLLGYAYAHFTGRLGVRRQAMLHLALIGASLLLMPLAMKTELGFAGVESPIRWVVTALALSVGVPFFLLAANAPLLQHWFAHTNHRDAANPYFLYAASNTGSMAALLGYPFLLEPNWGLSTLFWGWSVLYGVFALMLAVCGMGMLKAPPMAVLPVAPAAPPPSNALRLRWVVLAFVPSSLLLGVTTYITTDIASMPLFWVIPLAIYLLTFILAFARTPLLVDRALEAQISLVTIVALLIAFDVTFFTPLMILHLFAFFAVALGCHGQLVKSKPPASRLTEFYLWISVGGMLGGVFNSLVAPMVFTLPVEYPLVLFLAVLLRPRQGKVKAQCLQGAVFFAVIMALLYAVKAIPAEAVNAWLAGLPKVGGKPVSLTQLLAVGFFVLCMGAAWWMRERPLGFALVIGTILLAVPLTGSGLASAFYARTIYAERNFFGINRVIENPQVHFLVHGTTLHGTQSLDPALRLQMLSYYPPLKQALSHLEASIGGRPIAVIGLGGGTLACLASAGQPADLFEIDPVVVAIAQNPAYFTFLRDCPGKYRTVLGDGRLNLAAEPDGKYGLIVFDAFTSDAIPLHLITREAVAMYMSKLAPGGILALNISNNHLNLAPVVAAIAEANGLAVVSKREMNPQGPHTMPAIWALVARDERDLRRLPQAVEGWHVLIPAKGVTPWTDDYSNIFQVLM